MTMIDRENSEKKRVLLCICFDGSKYFGWQAQASGNTVQQKLQNAIEKVFRTKIDLSGCGRTDSGVHAKRYYCHIDVAKNFPHERIPDAVNLYLHSNSHQEKISVISAKEVDKNFHSRYYIKRKEYLYLIQNNRFQDPFYSEKSLLYHKPLNIDIMRKAADLIVGEKNFSSFMADNSKIPKEAAIRILDYIKIETEDDYSRLVKIYLCANGFLYKMVRIIVGTLIDVSEGKIKLSDIPAIIENQDRKYAGRTVDPKGLYLNSISYYTKSEMDEILRKREIYE